MTPHKFNWKTLSASVAAIGVVVFAYSDIIIEVAGKAAQDAEKGITVGTIGAIVYGINRKRRRKAFEQRDQRWEAKIDAIGEAVHWNLPESGSKKTEATSLKQCSKSSTGVGKVKEYLKKLGSRKFQAYLITTITNLVALVAVWTGNTGLEGRVNEYMPLINLGIQALATVVYVWVEGKVDKENVKATGTHENQEPGDHGPAV